MKIPLMVVMASFVVAAEDWGGNIIANRTYRSVMCSRCIKTYPKWGCAVWRYFRCTKLYTDYRCAPGWRHNGNRVCNIPICNAGCGPGTCTCIRPNTCQCLDTHNDQHRQHVADDTAKIIAIAVVVPAVFLLAMVGALIMWYVCKKKTAEKRKPTVVQPFEFTPNGLEVYRNSFKPRDNMEPTEYM